MKLIHALFYSLMVLILASCERVAEVQVPHTDPQPVMFAFISPDESDIVVSLTMSQPVFNSTGNEEFAQQKHAWVQISDSKGNKKVFPFNLNIDRFQLSQTDFPIEAGETYTLEANFDTYSLKGICTVPVDVVYYDSVYAQYMGQGQWGEDQYRFYLRWKDLPHQVNYYRINLEDFTSNTGMDTTSIGIGDKVITDKDKDGEMLSEKAEYYYYDFQGSKPQINAYLLNSDQAYYEYHRRRLNYFGDDPFSEPYPQFSNVKGGLGVVAAFRKSRIQIPLP